MGSICTKDTKDPKENQITHPITNCDSPKGKKIVKDMKIHLNLIVSDNEKKFKTETEQSELTDRIQTQTINPETTISIPSTAEKMYNGKKHSNTKAKIQLGSEFQSNEANILKILKKHNRVYEDSQLIETCLMKHFFMRSLDKQARGEIVKQMSLAYVPKDTVIFKQGAIGSYFYILREGRVELVINEKSIKFIDEGENFGELALLHGAPRSGTIIADTDCFLWVLERKNFRKIIDHITHTNYEENKKFIQSMIMFNAIDQSQKNILCSSLLKQVFDAGTYIFKENELSSCLYVIKEGEVEVSSKGKFISILSKGDNFGERGLLTESDRTMDVIAKNKCVCFSVSIQTIKNMFGSNYKHHLYSSLIKMAFSLSEKFHDLNPKMLDNVSYMFKPMNLPKDTVAYEKGYDTSSKIIVVIDGNLIKSTTKEIIGHRGSIMYEHNVFHEINNTIDYDLIAYPDCLLVEVNTKDILNKLGSSFIDIIDKSTVIECLQLVSIFKNLSQNKLSGIVDKIKVEKVSSGMNIITQGEEGTKFFIVKKGKIDIVINGKYIRTINQNDYLGERALFFKEPRSASAVAKGNAEVFYLEKEDFMSTIEDNMKIHLMNRLYLQDNTIELNDLEYIDPLGTGNYGTVSLVQARTNHFHYAIKCISKRQIESEILISNLELERSILLQIDHPFIVKLVKTLKNDNNLFFLMEYIKGKELFDVIREIGLLNKTQTQFYGASMMLAVEYLHERKVIYRDIKPENIIVVDNGYIKLIDFGTAKIITDRTATVIGTPHYMAPEVILGEGYSFQVDFWSIAICMFEFICGVVPFGESAEDPMDVYMAIINDQLAIPPYCKDKDFKQLITQMLCKNPLARICKIGQIKNQIWLQNFDWEGLVSLNLKPAVIPKIDRDDSKAPSMNYLSYVSKYIKEWEPTTDVYIDSKSKASAEALYKKF